MSANMNAVGPLRRLAPYRYTLAVAVVVLPLLVIANILFWSAVLNG